MAAKKQTPAVSNPANIAKFPQTEAFKLPGNESLFSHLSSKTTGNLTNLTKSQITISPSKALPCP